MTEHLSCSELKTLLYNSCSPRSLLVVTFPELGAVLLTSLLGGVEVCLQSRETCRYLKSPNLACSLLIAGNSTLHSRTLEKGVSKPRGRGHQGCLIVARSFSAPCFSHARWKDGGNAEIIRKLAPLCHFLSLNSENRDECCHPYFVSSYFFTVAVLNMLLAVNLRV